MKVVALLSGGKDSIYNTMKCVEYGHEIVCIGNLRPAPLNVDELDSEMYQTVGWNGVELIAKAMDIPFYYKTTNGKSKQNTVSYNHLDDNINNDEVEDMFNLLKEIKIKHPDINAVSTGAILSNYQRNRVESVCERLKLVNLSYLWQRTDQDILLKEMINNNIDAIIIKCASMGLTPNEFLGKSIKNEIIYDKLKELGELYGMNICGEGGEYETFVIDCPLFKKFKLNIDESSICGNINDPISPNGYLKFDKISLIEKEEEKNINNDINDSNNNNNNNNIDTFEEDKDWKLLNVNDFLPFYEPEIIETTNVCNYGSKNGIFQFVSHPNVSINSKYISDLDLKSEVNLLFNALEIKLKKYGLTFDNLFYCQLFLNDMSLFNTINQIYKSYFKKIFPPSRVCCQLDLNNKHQISLEALGYKNKYNVSSGIQLNKQIYQCLHIQSISEWAPNCIGPYSQASKIDNKFVFAAGVIGLIPATMKMIKNIKPKQQIHLAFKNINAVLTAFDSKLSLGIHHNIFILAAPEQERKFDESMVKYEYDYPNNDIDDDNIESDDELQQQQQHENKDNNDDDDDVITSKKMDPYLLQIVQKSAHKNITNDNINEEKQNDDENNKLNYNKLNYNAVVIYVPDLPRHALIEIQTLSLTKQCINNLNAARSEPISIEPISIEPIEGNKNKLSSKNDSNLPKRNIKLKYAHIKRKKKKKKKVDIHAICTDSKQNEIGNFFIVKTRTIYNLYDKWCSVVSICELTSQQTAKSISELIKGALSQSILNVNGYGYILQNQNKNDHDNDTNSIWTERSIVFLRIYYECEALEPRQLMTKIESCFNDIGINKIPAISMIPCRGVCFINNTDSNDINHNFGLYMIHCFLYEQ